MYWAYWDEGKIVSGKYQRLCGITLTRVEKSPSAFNSLCMMLFFQCAHLHGYVNTSSPHEARKKMIPIGLLISQFTWIPLELCAIKYWGEKPQTSMVKVFWNHRLVKLKPCWENTVLLFRALAISELRSRCKNWDECKPRRQKLHTWWATPEWHTKQEHWKSGVKKLIYTQKKLNLITSLQ